jgi:alpha-L-fucosidase
MKKSFYIVISAMIAWLVLISCNNSNKLVVDISPNKVVPSEKLIAYQQMELIGFIHFTVNTFTNKEWGYGDESPEIFNPSELNVEQWVKTAKSAGMQELILTAKHHDGFCLWPSQYTKHSIKNSPYNSGEGDIVKEFVEACRKHGLKVGLYLSPWDRNHKDYGKAEYITYYENQLRELLTQYGTINEIWFDGANGGDGYYGGANEVRKIDSKTYYNWENIFSIVKELQPDIKIFSDAGPDVHWIGNERGFAGSTFWSTINQDSLVIGNSNTMYLNSGDPLGTKWIVGQCDVSIRPGWFYHSSEDSLVKTPQELVDIYYKSVGSNAVMLLNLPPDKRGLIHENDVKSLQEFKKIIDETFAVNLTEGASAIASNYRLNRKKFDPENVLDDNDDSYWATDDSVLSSELIVQLPEDRLFDRILIQEPIKYGQRIREFELDIMENNHWKTIFQGTTIGYKRLLQIDPVKASKIRLRILNANNTIAISRFGLFKADKNEK